MNYDTTSDWSGRFSVLVERYQHVIRGMYFGHAHYEAFNVFKSTKLPRKNIAFSHSTSSLTTFVVANPSFTVINMDSQYFVPVSIQQIYFDVYAA